MPPGDKQHPVAVQKQKVTLRELSNSFDTIMAKPAENSSLSPMIESEKASGSKRQQPDRSSSPSSHQPQLVYVRRKLEHDRGRKNMLDSADSLNPSIFSKKHDNQETKETKLLQDKSQESNVISHPSDKTINGLQPDNSAATSKAHAHGDPENPNNQHRIALVEPQSPSNKDSNAPADPQKPNCQPVDHERPINQDLNVRLDLKRPNDQAWKIPVDPKKPHLQDCKIPVDPHRPSKQDCTDTSDPERPSNQDWNAPANPERPSNQDHKPPVDHERCSYKYLYGPIDPQKPREQKFQAPVDHQRSSKQHLNGPLDHQRSSKQHLNGPLDPQRSSKQHLNGPLDPQRPRDQGNRAPADPQRPISRDTGAPVEPQRQQQINQDWKERYCQLQVFLKDCDQSSQEDYKRMLRSLTAAGRSRHALGLERRALNLLLQEAEELRRMTALNVVGEAKLQDHASPSTQTSTEQTQFHRMGAMQNPNAPFL